MHNQKNLEYHDWDTLKMFIECTKFDTKGEIKSKEQIITNFDFTKKIEQLQYTN